MNDDELLTRDAFQRCKIAKCEPEAVRTIGRWRSPDGGPPSTIFLLAFCALPVQEHPLRHCAPPLCSGAAVAGAGAALRSHVEVPMPNAAPVLFLLSIGDRRQPRLGARCRRQPTVLLEDRGCDATTCPLCPVPSPAALLSTSGTGDEGRRSSSARPRRAQCRRGAPQAWPELCHLQLHAGV